MKIGICNFFPFRPHVEHMSFLAKSFIADGHDLFYLDCLWALNSCYNLEIKAPALKWTECAKCSLGGMRTYLQGNFTSISSDLRSELSDADLDKMSLSSSYTLTRVEDPKDFESSGVTKFQSKLRPSVSIVYANAKKWLSDNKIQYVFLFNGRMDITRAVLEACQDLSIKCITVERTWFGHGLQLNLSGNCLSLTDLRKLSRTFLSKPLTKIQAQKAASYIISRFFKNNVLEWRQYNTESKSRPWPSHKATNKKKILIIPSSKNEQLSHPDWSNPWVEYLSIFDKLISKFDNGEVDCVVRGHPNWGQLIGSVGGSQIETYYKKWCSERGYAFLDSNDNTDTASLIEQCDYVIVNGSSAAYEAGILGKKIVCVSKCHYDTADFLKVITNYDDLDAFSPHTHHWLEVNDIIRHTLRFVYLFADRYALFKSNIVARTTTEYVYGNLLDVKRILDMVDLGQLNPDDIDFSQNCEGEDSVIERITHQDWMDFKFAPYPVNAEMFNKEKRRFGLRWIDRARNLQPRGDLKKG
ncbi:MAG: hypothetical protein R3B45_14230 [Bdellovibrionota bacterium]